MITVTGVINDLHLPLHDPRAVNLTLDIFESIGINRLVINGDLLDFYLLNSHGPKHPDIQFVLEDELHSGKAFLEDCRKRFPKAEIVFLFGNHEDRLQRFITNNCPAFWNILRIEKMLTLEHLGIEWHDYQTPYQLEKTNLRIIHSPPSYGINGAMTSLTKKLDQNWIYGCTHRMQHACRTGSSGEVYNAWFNGWLGSTDLTDQHKAVFRYTKNHENWQQCAMIIAVQDEKDFSVNQFQIRNYKAAVNGHWYEG